MRLIDFYSVQVFVGVLLGISCACINSLLHEASSKLLGCLGEEVGSCYMTCYCDLRNSTWVCDLKVCRCQSKLGGQAVSSSVSQ